MSHDEFVRACGPIYEKSPWIAAGAAAQRPFASAAALLGATRAVVHAAPPERQLALICAHPDLATRLALTQESQREQTGAGLTELTPVETALFRSQNDAYRKRFSFPFIVCARLNSKDAILAAFDRRLNNSRDDEIQTALAEIFKIAELRLRDLCPEN